MVNLKLIDGSIIDLNLNSEDLQNHFNDRRNCTLEILHQFNDLNYYDKFISKEDKTILDLGANIGLFSIHASPYAEKIIALEPTPAHFKLLTELTSSFKNITPINLALSNKSGTERFYTCEDNTTMNSLINRNGNFFDTKSISLKDLIEEININKIDFIKIDIEGSEFIALDEESINYISDKVNKIFMEVHDIDGSGFDRHREKFAELFKKNNFTVDRLGIDVLFAHK